MFAVEKIPLFIYVTFIYSRMPKPRFGTSGNLRDSKKYPIGLVVDLPTLLYYNRTANFRKSFLKNSIIVMKSRRSCVPQNGIYYFFGSYRGITMIFFSTLLRDTMEMGHPSGYTIPSFDRIIATHIILHRINRNTFLTTYAKITTTS